MGWQHEPAGIIDIDKSHKGEINGIIGMKATALLAYFGLIGEGCFIAMVSISDIELALGKEALDESYLLWIVDRMEAMLFASLVNDADCRVGRIIAEQAANTSLGIFVHAHNRAKIGGACPVEIQAIFFSFCQGMFMWEYN